MLDGSERGLNELWSSAVDPEDASSEVEVVAVDEVNQWLRGLHSRRTVENLGQRETQVKRIVEKY